MTKEDYITYEEHYKEIHYLDEEDNLQLKITKQVRKK